MTEPLFFDTDCLSAFLWVNNESLLARLYPGRVIIPQSVYAELSVPGIAHLKRRVDALIQNGDASIKHMDVGSEEHALYQRLTTHPDAGHKIIGRGEASAIAMSKCNNGVLASNNLKDIADYVAEYNLKHVTTGDILFEAFTKGYINETQGNALWANMLAKRRKLGYSSFSDYLQQHQG